jgi:hypothetical protein
MSTTAILCIARNETPFTEEWLEYHIKIGIERVYYISTDYRFNRVKACFESYKYRDRVELLHFDSFQPGWQMRCYNDHLPLIKEEWILVIDIDEYLYLNTYPSIQAFLETVDSDAGQMQFPWLNVMSNEYCHGHMNDILKENDKYVSDHVKSMARRNCTSHLGIHAHSIHKMINYMSSGLQISSKPHHAFLFDDIEYYEHSPFVLHFSSRGHFDVLCRILDHKFFNTKTGQNEHQRLLRYLLGGKGWSNIPTRYMLMQFYLSLPKANIQCELPNMESRTDVHGLKEIFLEKIKKIMQLDEYDIESLEARFENRYHLAQNFASQNIAQLFNRDDYLKCNTQLEYIDNARKTLLKKSKTKIKHNARLL